MKKPVIAAKIIKVKSAWAPKKKIWGNAKFKNCCYCELSMPIEDVTREHLIPRSGGGTFIAACCLQCNREKGNLLLIDWIIQLYAEQRKEWTRKNELKIRNAIKYLLLLYPGEYDFIF